ncbi:unnamed protein product [Tenebrio molitor]|nr:unnamed protein product [Tenebrio molitor]
MHQDGATAQTTLNYMAVVCLSPTQIASIHLDHPI